MSIHIPTLMVNGLSRTILFTPDDPCNTTLTDLDTGEALYTVSTSFADLKNPITTVCAADGAAVASWVWRTGADLLTLGARPQAPSSNWLSRSWIPYFSRKATFTDDSGRKYRWENIAPGALPQLFSADSKKPIALFRPRPAALLLGSAADAIRDMAVVSFLLLERRRREAGMETEGRAYAMFTIADTGGGGN